MKKASIIILSSLILFFLVSRSLTFADENGKGNEKKNENGAQVTTQGEFKIVENKNKIIIKIKTQNHEEDDDEDDEDDEDDDDNVINLSPTPTAVVSTTPTPTPNLSVTPTISPEVTPTTTPSGEPTVSPTPTAQTQVNLNAKIKGTFTLDQLAAIFEGILNAIKNALGTI